MHYQHLCFEQNLVVGLVKLSQLFPSEAAEWKKAIKLYADYYKEICNYTVPYYMIPAGIYDLTNVRNETEAEQVRSGIKLNERFYMKRFPVWGDARGNCSIILSQANGLAGRKLLQLERNLGASVFEMVFAGIRFYLIIEESVFLSIYISLVTVIIQAK